MSAIYISQPGSQLHIRNHQLEISHRGQLQQSIPLDDIDRIVLFGLCHLSRPTVRWVLGEQIPVLFIGEGGRDLGCLEPQNHPKYFKTQLQRVLDCEFTRTIAQSLVRVKLHHQTTLLQQLHRECPTSDLRQTIGLLSLLADDLPAVRSLEDLRDSDATATTLYHATLVRTLARNLARNLACTLTDTQPLECCESHASRAIQWMLNLGYALLHQQIATLARNLGLDTEIAHLYLPSEHHQALACDLMSEFRPLLVDKLAISLARDNAIFPKDLTFKDVVSEDIAQHQTRTNPSRRTSVGCKAIETFASHWEMQLQTLIVHPQAGTVSFDRSLELQVEEYLACILGDTESYQPLLPQFPQNHR
ncbi:MAG: CRISPR-associated endonuclease Cas1 [Cyanobacteriota bacterium]|nr:CRISPR-associated endonuclease Cas1 [Cyanobacteriota bacterium]